MEKVLERVIPIINYLEGEELKLLYKKLQPFIKAASPREKETLSWKGTLILTDCAEGVELARQAGLPCIGLEQADILSCRYLVTDVEAITAEYLERVYRRFYVLPWDILETKRCIVRETVEEDAEFVLELYEDALEFSLQPPFANLQEGREYIRQYRENIYEFYEFGLWTVEEKGTGRLIGIAGLENQIIQGEEYLALGYMIDRAWRRLGYGEEVCRAILEYGRRELGLSKIHCFIEPKNDVSRALAEKLGFQKVEKQALWHYIWNGA